MRLGVVADDLTGACDVASTFAAVGLRTAVRLAADCNPGDLDVLVHDANVRDTPGPRSDSAAMPRFLGCVKAIESSGARLRMLKIDSTLRGPVGPMVAALLHRPDVVGAIIAPAFPHQGRYLSRGCLTLGDPAAPNLVSVAALLEDAGMRVKILAAEVARSSVDELEQTVLSVLSHGAQAIVIDTDTERCLENAAETWARHSQRLLLVGSAGVARHAATVLARQDAGHADRVREVLGTSQQPKTRRGILVVSGSPTSETAAQIEILALEEGCQVFEIEPDTSDEHPFSTSDTGARDLICLRTPLPKVAARDRPLLSRDGGEHAGSLARAVGELAERSRPAGLMLIGGATARVVLEELEACGIDVCGEVEPGIPYGTICGGRWDGIPVVTKAGGFGDANSVLRAVRQLYREDE